MSFPMPGMLGMLGGAGGLAGLVPPCAVCVACQRPEPAATVTLAHGTLVCTEHARELVSCQGELRDSTLREIDRADGHDY